MAHASSGKCTGVWRIGVCLVRSFHRRSQTLVQTMELPWIQRNSTRFMLCESGFGKEGRFRKFGVAAERKVPLFAALLHSISSGRHHRQRQHLQSVPGAIVFVHRRVAFHWYHHLRISRNHHFWYFLPLRYHGQSCILRSCSRSLRAVTYTLYDSHLFPFATLGDWTIFRVGSTTKYPTPSECVQRGLRYSIHS